MNPPSAVPVRCILSCIKWRVRDNGTSRRSPTRKRPHGLRMLRQRRVQQKLWRAPLGARAPTHLRHVQNAAACGGNRLIGAEPGAPSSPTLSNFRQTAAFSRQSPVYGVARLSPVSPAQEASGSQPDPVCRLPHRPLQRQSAHGFTLIELLVTLAVASILLSVAVPNFQQFIRNARTTALSNELVTAINLARSEAIKRRDTVRVCASEDLTNCNGSDWTKGWIVRLETGSDPVLRVSEDQPDPANVVASGSGDTSVLEYRRDGTVAEGRQFAIHFDGCTGEEQRRIRVNAMGRPDVAREACP